MKHKKIAVIVGSALACLSFAGTSAVADNSSAPPVDGTSVNQFFNSGPVIDSEAMERASIPADQAVSLPPDHSIKRLKPGHKPKKTGLFSSLGKAFAHTCNFIGFPVGQDNDVDASLSSDLKNEDNLADRKRGQQAQARAAQQSQTVGETTTQTKAVESDASAASKKSD